MSEVSQDIPYYMLADFGPLNFIAQGGQGIVTIAKHGDFGQIALKQFICPLQDSKKEIDILIRHKHPNIIQLYGILWDGSDKTIYLGYIMEYVKGGSLHDHIHDTTITYDSRQAFVWIEQMALGIQFLHKNGIIHRDIKPKNILVASGNQLKLADFGTAKTLDISTTAGAGTIGYMAPEVLLGKSHLSSDIYSLAITIWEIFHRKSPYYEWKDVSTYILSDRIVGGARPAIESGKMVKDVAELTQRCWQRNEVNRPLLKEIIDYIEKKTDIANRAEVPRRKKSLGGPLQVSPIGKNTITVYDVRHDALKLPKDITVLLLGTTGGVKSIFVNELANYLKYATLQEAEEKGAIPGENGTQYPKSYKFVFERGRKKRIITIIDTPDIQDLRGPQQAKENCNSIISFLSEFKQINAICIMLRPNMARLTVDDHYCINEILCHFPVSAAPNILFCFSHSRSTLYKPGETMAALENHFMLYKDDIKACISLNEKTIYGFDSEAFRYLCDLNVDAVTAREKFNLRECWDRSSKETFRLFKTIAELQPFDVRKTMDVNNIRSAILTMATSLEEIPSLLLKSINFIEKRTKDIENLTLIIEDLKKKLYVNQVFFETKELAYPAIVCTADKCVELMHVSSDPASSLQTFHKSRCHDPFFLEGVKLNWVPCPDLKTSRIFRKDIQQCENCGCPWTTHMCVRYTEEKKSKVVTDSVVERKIKQNEENMRVAQLYLEEEQKKKNELIKDSATITNYRQDFAAFLKKNSILAFNPTYAIHMSSTDPNIEEKCQKFRIAYGELVRLVNETSNSDEVCPIEIIYQMVDDLKRLRHTGELFKEAQADFD